MHIIHDWCLDYMTGSYICYKINCPARITQTQLFSRGDVYYDMNTHLDEMWNIYKSHG